jgi:TolB-like protein
MVARDSLLPKREGRGVAADGGAPGGAKADRDGARTFISVMDFSAGSPNGDLDWMRGAIRDNLNSRLSASPDCKVFSKEFIDFKAQQMVREGEYRDVKAATMEVAQRLGVTKAVLGSFRADRDVLHIEAHLVDMETGVQEASEIVEGSESRFAELQAALAKKLMARLGVAPAPEAEPVQAAESNADLDDYRLLLQAEGQAGAAEPMPAATGAPRRDRHGSLRVPLGVAAAYAAATDDATLSAEEQIRATLERYRRACEHKDLAELQEVYQQLSPPQIEANRRYFANARDLSVSFEEIDVAVGGDEAAVSYTRKDNFVDNGTARPTKVEVRLTKMMVRVDGAWKLVSTAPKK